jgi:hypothetical protein
LAFRKWFRAALLYGCSVCAGVTLSIGTWHMDQQNGCGRSAGMITQRARSVEWEAGCTLWFQVVTIRVSAVWFQVVTERQAFAGELRASGTDVNVLDAQTRCTEDRRWRVHRGLKGLVFRRNHSSDGRSTRADSSLWHDARHRGTRVSGWKEDDAVRPLTHADLPRTCFVAEFVAQACAAVRRTAYALLTAASASFAFPINHHRGAPWRCRTRVACGFHMLSRRFCAA